MAASTSSAALASRMARSLAMTSAALRRAASQLSWAWIAFSMRATSRSFAAGTWLKTLR